MAKVRAIVRTDLDVAALSAISRGGLDRPLLHPAELLVAVPAGEGVVLGAHQRTSEVEEHAAGLPIDRRGSGGPEARVGTGSVWLQLALADSSALVPCPPERLLNRYVRPLLRAITKLGVLAHYFERDWVSGAKRPVAEIAFGHDASSGRALVEAMIAVTTPFSIRARPSTMGKEPKTLAELGMRASPLDLAESIVSSYETAYAPSLSLSPAPAPALSPAPALPPAPPWTSTRTEAIGLLGAGRDAQGRLRIGGELMVSRDALARLEDALAALEAPADPDAIGALVDATLGAPGVALFGVRSLRSIRDVIVEAIGQ